MRVKELTVEWSYTHNLSSEGRPYESMKFTAVETVELSPGDRPDEAYAIAWKSVSDQVSGQYNALLQRMTGGSGISVMQVGS